MRRWDESAASPPAVRLPWALDNTRRHPPREEAQHMEYIAFDAHKHYTLASVARPDGQLVREQRIAHERGALQQFLERCERGSPVAVETVGNWYWIIDEIEAAGCIPRLVHARKAKLMKGEINKTDKLDVRGLNQLQRTGTLPTVWIPPGELRDQRDLPRTRMVLVRQRTQLKNRIHATLAKYALHDLEVSDLFGARGRALLRQRLELLPPRHSPLRARRPAQRPPEGDRGRRPPSGRSDVLGPHETGVLSGTTANDRFVHGG